MTDQQSTEMNIRFLTLNGQQSVFSFSKDSDFSAIKKQLLDHWPTEFEDPPTDGSNIKFIFAGRFLKDSDTLQGLNITPNSTVHLAISRPQSQPPEQTTAASQPGLDEYHLHWCVFDEQEAEDITKVFERKKRVNGRDKITFTQMKQFLHDYWGYIKRTQLVDNVAPFPEERLVTLWQKVSRGSTTDDVSFDQFRIVFFLFCNTPAPDTPCPHGQKERVRAATEQLHRPSTPEAVAPTPFQNDIFEKLFSEVDYDSDGVLTCAESELLFYLYSSELLRLPNPPVPAGGAAL